MFAIFAMIFHQYLNTEKSMNSPSENISTHCEMAWVVYEQSLCDAKTKLDMHNEANFDLKSHLYIF